MIRRIWPLLAVVLLATLIVLGCSQATLGNGDALAVDPMVAAAGAWVAGNLTGASAGSVSPEPLVASVTAIDASSASPTPPATDTPPSTSTATATPTATEIPATATLTATATRAPTSTPMPTATTVPTLVPTAVPPTAVPTVAPTAVPPTVPPPPPTAVPPPPAVPTAVPTAVPAPAYAGALGGDAAEQAAFAELNRRRSELGLAPLRPMVTLFMSAHLHSQDMAAARFFGHTGTDGSDPGARMRAAGYNWANWGEAVARSKPGDIAGVVQALLDSPPHREILFTSGFTDGGVGVSYSPEGVPYWTFDVANPRG